MCNILFIYFLPLFFVSMSVQQIKKRKKRTRREMRCKKWPQAELKPGPFRRLLNLVTIMAALGTALSISAVNVMGYIIA